MYLNNYQSSIFGFVIIGLLSFIACEQTLETNKIVDFGTKATVSQSKSVWFGTDTLIGLKLTVAEIADSRCPNDPTVQCVWGGEAKVKLLAVSKIDSVKLSLTISPEKNSKTDTLNFSLNSKSYKALLYSVDPYPNSKTKGEKFATFTILSAN